MMMGNSKNSRKFDACKIYMFTVSYAKRVGLRMQVTACVVN